jgi:hypothetical protein
MPECIEHERLTDLQDAQWSAADELVSRMWALPAQTPEGRRSKLLVLLGFIMDDDHGKTSYEIKRARSLMIEFVGGDPSAQLRDQFSPRSRPPHRQAARRFTPAGFVSSFFNQTRSG